MIEQLLFIIVAAIIIFFMIRKRYLFKIEINNTTVKVHYGHPPAKFLTECKSAVLFHKPKKGFIYGVKNNQQILLKFSKNFNARKQQVFRNIWTEYPPIMNTNNGKKTG
ncbi:MAG: hypothetical protein methR_P1686 [Methyloprofundus sp.]|nr:MAG: hypothetical protein methR_P1686 [Methyloprofundus sp.]